MIMRYFLSALILAPVALHAMEKQVPFEEKMTEFTFVNESDSIVSPKSKRKCSGLPRHKNPKLSSVYNLLAGAEERHSGNMVLAITETSQIMENNSNKGTNQAAQEINKHFQPIQKLKVYECACGIGDCDFTAAIPVEIKEHRYTHLQQDSQPYCCSVCKKSLLRNLEGTIHIGTAHNEKAKFEYVPHSLAALKVINAKIKRKASEAPITAKWHDQKRPYRILASSSFEYPTSSVSASGHSKEELDRILALSELPDENFSSQARALETIYNVNEAEPQVFLHNSSILQSSVSTSTIDSQKSEDDSLNQVDPLDEFDLSEAQIDQYVQNFLSDKSE